MHRRFRARATAALGPIAATLLVGCAQMTLHSNTMVFGTNTSLGVIAGTSAGNVPSVTIGYHRQEAVILPLVANTAVDANHGSYRLIPCPSSATSKIERIETGADGAPHTSVTTTTTNELPKNCLLIAHDVTGDRTDAYSVLASFGATVGGTSGTGPQASGKIAQYFATGVAAQKLAENGGAAVVALGGAAAANATAVGATANKPDAFQVAEAKRDLLKDKTNADTIKNAREKIATCFMLTPANKVADTRKAFQDATEHYIKFENACVDGQSCRASFLDSGLFDDLPADKLDAGLTAIRLKGCTAS